MNIPCLYIEIRRALQGADSIDSTPMQHYKTLSNVQKMSLCALIGKVIDQDKIIRANIRTAGIIVSSEV